MNMLAAVGQAAEHKARLVELVYEDRNHASEATRGETLCMVGKGACVRLHYTNHTHHV